jgi:hypothetical protein
VVLRRSWLSGWSGKLGQRRVREGLCFRRRDAEQGQHQLDHLVPVRWVSVADDLTGALCCHGTDHALAAKLQIIAADDAGVRERTSVGSE